MSERTSYKSELRQEYGRQYPDWNTVEDSDIPAYIPWLEQQIEELRELFVYFFGENYQELEDE